MASKESGMNREYSGLLQDSVSRGAAVGNEVNVCSADCSVMRVTYFPSRVTADLEGMSDVLEIVISAKDPLLYLSFRAAGGKESS